MPNLRVGIILIRDGGVLLMQHRRRGLAYWVLPGGQARDFEGAVECAHREMREETGLEVSPGPLLVVFETYDRSRDRHDVNLVFLATAVRGALTGPSGGPAGEGLDRAAFVDRLALASLELRPARLRPWLLRLLDGERPPAAYLGDLSDADWNTARRPPTA